MKFIDLSKDPKDFSYLLRQDEVISPKKWPKTKPVKRFVIHSSEVKKGDVFLAVPPLADENKGQAHLKEAIDNKASVIIKQRDMPLPISAGDVSIIDVENVRRTRALLARRLFVGQPSKISAVTGTNGKTSTVGFCRQIWEQLGYKSASLGTLGYESSVKIKGLTPFSLTSPDPFYLHQLLAQAKLSGVTHLALEASSHGLDQYRLDGVDFCSAGFTNLSQDHLDYHGNMVAYFESKARLFNTLLPDGETAVINADTKHFSPLSQACKERGIRVIGYGREAEEIRLLDLTLDRVQQVAHISVMKRNYKLRLNFIGKFQVLNALCAAGMVIGSGVNAGEVLPLLEQLQPIQGRLELIGYTKAGGAIYVDYAHTPDALHSALLSVRPYVSGILTAVFGCGGDRDKEKRPLMGSLANKFSDAQIITDDNPRNEDPAEIRKHIMRMCPHASEIGDRHEAIKKAIGMTGKNDAVLIAGKGHEQFQLVKDKKNPFDDREIVRTLLKDSGGRLAA